MSQPPIDGFPAEPQVTIGGEDPWGWLYVCINQYGVTKVGRSETPKTKLGRLKSHRLRANMWEVFAHRVPNYREEEAAIKQQLRAYRIAGTEWFDLTHVHAMKTLVDALERLGGNTWQLRIAFARHVSQDPRFREGA